MRERSIKDLLDGLVCADQKDFRVTGIAYRSDAVVPGDAFFCIPGTRVDGHSFARDAIASGAVALVVDHLLDVETPQYVVDDVRAALALASARYFDLPSEKLKVIGITGTNGKTTTTYLVEWILRSVGRRTGLIGTVETRIGPRIVPSERTTPESYELQKLFAHMVDEGVSDVVMEVSSHAVDLRRIDATHFAAVAFSNLTQDHLDYHGDLESYFQAKASLFLDHRSDSKIICIDSDWGKRLYSMVSSTGATALTISRGSFGDLRISNERASAAGTEFDLRWRGEIHHLQVPLVGAFNVENAVLAAGCALAVGIPMSEICSALVEAPQVPGRLERVSAAERPFSVLVDYAHTPDSLEKAIGAVRDVTDGRVLVVFGCGGDRDTSKRPLMGAAALAADIAVVTSDNPRSEKPEEIVAHIVAGMTEGIDRTFVEVDRRSAIAHAISLAEPGDCVLIAGKGHEDYQIVGDRILSFDDRIVAREELDRLC